MTPERWQQIEALYHSVREMDPGTRAAYLEDACGGDDELRREVESLLTSNGSLLERGLWNGGTATIDAQRAGFNAGMQLGPYRIEARVGAGGMGEVFRAVDTRLNRTVAIKILARHRAADSERKRRFLQEARAASALNHPGIVTLHDIANDSGVDYLVMEYVQGTSLDKLIQSGALPLHTR
jgi:serine/threonine protein kinase